ncbi:LacI family DNA-binding transcriptional regulator [Marinomonas sp.]|uniref:LacI family DNA-binding transcriptional regulator n=1 Tax=Marinomonas sp. TaxID=1904862 RepID=UPI003A8D808B
MPPSQRRKQKHSTSSRVSLAMVAAHAKVSTATASRIINGITNKASEQTIIQVKKAVKELGYRPASIGRALRCQESRMVGVLAASLANPTMSAMASSIEWALRDEGYIMSLCDTHEEADIQDEYLREMQSQLARAVVIIGAVKSELLSDYRDNGTTLLFVNRPAPDQNNSHYVGINNYQAGVDVANILLQNGKRHIGIIHASLEFTAAAERRRGLLDRLAEEGINPEDIPHAHAEGLNHLEVGYKSMQTLLEMPKRPDVIVCLSDMLAYGAYRLTQEMGLDTVEDFTFFGFDDNPLNPWIANWLNSVGVPASLYGPATVATLKTIWNQSPPTEPVYLPHQFRLNKEFFPLPPKK